MSRLSVNTYGLPIPVTAELLAITTDSPAHTGVFVEAIDFLVPVDTPVIAPLSGVVSVVSDGHTQHGPSAKYADKVNYICLAHDNNEHSEYLHLAADSIEVEPNMRIQTGQLLGRTGLSGWMTAPHLHWFVYHSDKSKPTPSITGLKPCLSNEAAQVFGRFLS